MIVWLLKFQTPGRFTDVQSVMVLPRDGVRLGILLARHRHSLDHVGLRGQLEALVLDVDEEHDGRDEITDGGGPVGKACETGIGDDSVDALWNRY